MFLLSVSQFPANVNCFFNFRDLVFTFNKLDVILGCSAKH